MSQGEVAELKKLLLASQADHDLKHSQMMEKIEALSVKVEPVCKVYDNLSGFGGVINWIVKYLVIPASIVIGIVVAWKNLK